MFCSGHFTGKLDFFTSHFHYNLYLKWIVSIISYILSLWNLFETKIVANGALDPPKTCFISPPENKFSITGELTAQWVKSWFILYYKIFASWVFLELANCLICYAVVKPLIETASWFHAWLLVMNSVSQPLEMFTSRSWLTWGTPARMDGFWWVQYGQPFFYLHPTTSL